MKLTEKIVAALTLAAGKTERVESDDDTTGLYFRMRRNGQGKIKRSWFFRYAGGKPSVDYPAYNLVAARTWAGQMQAKVRLGGDPAQERREGKDRAAVTMGATLPAYFDHKRALMRPRSFEQVQRHLGKNFAPLHRHPMTGITLAIVAARITAIVVGNGPTEAKNSLRSVHAFFMWASRRGLISSNPAIGVELPPDRKRSRVLNADELAGSVAGDRRGRRLRRHHPAVAAYGLPHVRDRRAVLVGDTLRSHRAPGGAGQERARARGAVDRDRARHPRRAAAASGPGSGVRSQ